MIEVFDVVANMMEEKRWVRNHVIPSSRQAILHLPWSNLSIEKRAKVGVVPAQPRGKYQKGM